MANKYWVGMTDEWFDTVNWSLTPGGTGGAGIPTKEDIAIFDGESAMLECRLTKPIECKGISFNDEDLELIIVQTIK